MEVEGPGGQGPAKRETSGKPKGNRNQQQRGETDTATDQRVRGRHEGSGELGDSDGRRKTSARGDEQVATAKEEAQAAGGGGTVESAQLLFRAHL